MHGDISLCPSSCASPTKSRLGRNGKEPFGTYGRKERKAKQQETKQDKIFLSCSIDQS